MLCTSASQVCPAREQQGAASHYELLATRSATFGGNIRDQLVRLGSGAGFDPARDIEAITGNRWPHEYAYEYNPLWDPEWPEGKRPCNIALRRFGRITIANSDAAAAAYTDHAIALWSAGRAGVVINQFRVATRLDGFPRQGLKRKQRRIGYDESSDPRLDFIWVRGTMSRVQIYE